MLNFPTDSAYVRLLCRRMRFCLCVFELLLMHIYSLIRSSIKCLYRLRKLRTEFYLVCCYSIKFTVTLVAEMWKFEVLEQTRYWRQMTHAPELEKISWTGARLRNMWHACPKWRAETFHSQSAITAVPLFFICFVRLGSPYCEEHVYMYICLTA